MARRTKQKRLIAIMDEYQRRVGHRGVTMLEVSEWAIANGLYPTPTIFTRPEIQDDWDRRFEALCAESVGSD